MKSMIVFGFLLMSILVAVVANAAEDIPDDLETAQQFFGGRGFGGGGFGGRRGFGGYGGGGGFGRGGYGGRGGFGGGGFRGGYGK